MTDDLDALLREHYRRTAEGIVPDRELIERAARARRPAPVRTWPQVLAAAAAVVVVAVTWFLLRPSHRSEKPVAPPAPVVDVPPSRPPLPTPMPSPTQTRRPTASPSARPTARRPHPGPRRSRP